MNMTKLDSTLRKEIVRNLHAAIDSEITDNDKAAYSHYVESLRLVSEALKQDVASGSQLLTLKDRGSLIEFAKQSVARVSFILKREDPSYGVKTEHQDITPSAPKAQVLLPPSGNKHLGQTEDEEQVVSRYHARINKATSAFEKQNLELEFARLLVEKATITRNRLMHTTAWAMQNANSKFSIQEKLAGGMLKESDFRKQQLFALCLQFNVGSSWLKQCSQNLELYPNNDRLVRELLDNIISDDTHPIKCTLSNMHTKILAMLPLKKPVKDLNDYVSHFTGISIEIKEDINILIEVLKELYDTLKTDRNSYIVGEVINYNYFAPLKTSIINLIRQGRHEKEQAFIRNVNLYFDDTENNVINEDSRNEAITKLHYLTTLHSPYEMTDCSVHIIKLLTTSQFDKNHFTSVGADELLPRLCEVVVKSRLVDLGAEADFMEAFMPSEKAIGEEGYAVTMIQSAIQHIISNYGEQ